MPNTETARAFAPATVGNIICGFDVFGLALGEPGDEVEARVRNEPGVVISAVHGDGGRLPTEAARNVAGVATAAVLAECGMEDVGVEIDARTSGGRVEVDAPLRMRGSIDHSHVQGELFGGGPLLRLHTSGGNIRVRVR